MKHNFFPLKGVDMSNLSDLPIPSGNDIYWEPWIDAYDNEEVSNAKAMFEEEIKNIDEINSEEELLEEQELYDEFAIFQKPVKTIITPYGVLPLTETSLASSHFKFWVGHSNFKLMESFYSIIEDCAGVESLDILTPYRFRIAVGKMFLDRDVMHQVRNTLLGVIDESKK